MKPAERLTGHPALAGAILDLQAWVNYLQAFISALSTDPLPPEQIRAALAPETENQYEAI